MTATQLPADLDPEVRHSLERVEAERRSAEVDGDDERVAELDEMAAALLTSAGHEPEARRALRRALHARRRVGALLPLAKTRYGLALLEARVPGRHTQARRGLETAAAEFRSAGHEEMLGRALLRIAAIDVAEQSYADALGRCREASAAFERTGDIAARIEALRLGVHAAHVGGDPAEASRLLAAAVAAAPSPEDSVSLRLDAAALGLSDEPSEKELDDMLARVENEPMRGSLLLLRAARRAERRAYDAADEDASGARAIALDETDPVLYLFACLQIAGIRQAVGDRTGLLTALFTCQATLGDLLGDDARVPVLQIIHSLHTAWGNDVFEAEMRRYRAQFEEARS